MENLKIEFFVCNNGWNQTATTGKEMHKKYDARATLLICLFNLLFFFAVLVAVAVVVA